jgi:hypothetical protein
MALPRCRYCRELFTPSRYHPEQSVCSGSACQRQRRTDYHRQRINDDPLYRAQCRDSQKKWRDQHRDYMPNYRKSGRPTETRPEESVDSLPRLLEVVKNSAAVKLTSYPAAVWLISSDENLKNILAHARLILIEAAS